MAKPISENIIFAILGTLLLFLLINFNQELGIIYIFMLVIDFIIFYIDDFPSYKFDAAGKDNLLAIAYAAIGYGLFILFSTFSTAVLTPQSVVGGNFFNSVLQSQAANVPVLAQSQWLTILGWGIIIPIVETRFFFGRLMEFLSDSAKSPLSLTSVKTWFIMAIVSILFTVFHLTAKAASGNQALILTFIFGVISCAMVVYFKETKQAVGTHVISNSIAVLAKYKIINT